MDNRATVRPRRVRLRRRELRVFKEIGSSQLLVVPAPLQLGSSKGVFEFSSA